MPALEESLKTTRKNQLEIVNIESNWKFRFMRIEREPLTSEEKNLHRELFDDLNRSTGGGPNGAIRPYELDLLVEVYKAIKPSRSIEWGLGTGISTVALGKARHRLGLPGKHVSLDPFQKKFSNNEGIARLAHFSCLDSVDFQATSSEEYLIEAKKRGELFDFVFIDGAHDIGHKLTDACLAGQVLSKNAVVCFHDSFFTSTSCALTYLIDELGLSLVETGVETKLRRKLRSIKHMPRLGYRFSIESAYKIDFSLSVLVRNQ